MQTFKPDRSTSDIIISYFKFNYPLTLSHEVKILTLITLEPGADLEKYLRGVKRGAGMFEGGQHTI